MNLMVQNIQTQKARISTHAYGNDMAGLVSFCFVFYRFVFFFFECVYEPDRFGMRLFSSIVHFYYAYEVFVSWSIGQSDHLIMRFVSLKTDSEILKTCLDFYFFFVVLGKIPNFNIHFWFLFFFAIAVYRSE